jgi:hypothetical protein
VITRHLDRRHVQAFFDGGAIRLSSFASFREHSDKRMRDRREGLPVVETSSRNSEGVFLGVEESCHVLCSSVGEEVRPGLGKASGLVILDVGAFATSISKYVPGFLRVQHGRCTYQQDPSLRVCIEGKLERPPSDPKAAEAWFRRLHAFHSDRAREALFVKPLEFADQEEYRILWFVDRVAERYLDISCPEARPFCRPAGTR